MTTLTKNPPGFRFSQGHLIPKRINHSRIDMLLLTLVHLDSKLNITLHHEEFYEAMNFIKSLGCNDLILDYYAKSRGLELTMHKGEWYCRRKSDIKISPLYGINESKFMAILRLLGQLKYKKLELFTKMKSI